MATKIFPSTNDVNGGVAGQGKTLTEANLKTLQAMPYFNKPYVSSGAVCTNGGGLLLTVATGNYMIDGRWIYKDASENVTLTASSTNRVWLQLTKDGSGNVTGTTWNVQTGTTVPTDAVLVAVVVTGASTITTISQSARGIIAPGRPFLAPVTGATSSAALSAGTSSQATPVVTQQSTVTDGVTPISLELLIPSYYSNTAGQLFGMLINDADSPSNNTPSAAGGTGTNIIAYNCVTAPAVNNRQSGIVKTPAPLTYTPGVKKFTVHAFATGSAGTVGWDGCTLRADYDF